ncbi:MAG: MBL fold metallo-hydrolase, partial [Chloroflexi bacterium]|nr:MBL fold metallo-hydrolase [Chloroflexota bacterium]
MWRAPPGPPLRSTARSLEWAGLRLRVIVPPGHTTGSVSYYEESAGLLFSGDTL